MVILSVLMSVYNESRTLRTIVERVLASPVDRDMELVCVEDCSRDNSLAPQVGGQFEGDRSREEVLVDHGFRLPSAKDNRPLRFDQWLEKANQAIFLSATPSDFEISHSTQVVEQIIRPTGLVDSEVMIRTTKGQIDDLLHELREVAETG